MAEVRFRIAGALRIVFASVVIILVSLSSGFAQARDFAYRLNLWNEATATAANRNSPFNPDNQLLQQPVWANSLVAVGEMSYSLEGNLKIVGSFTNRFDHASRNTDRLRVKELYANLSLGSHWDISAGQKILKWGTGYGWTPTGVLDPPRDPRDPGDRLRQYQGRQLVEARAIFSSHSFTAVYSSPRFFSSLRTESRTDQWAFKYNTLGRGLDFSFIASIGGKFTPNRFGANASYVIGNALELHGEFAAQRGSMAPYPRAVAEMDPSQTYVSWPFELRKQHDGQIYTKTLAGLNYTFPGGWNLVLEYYRDEEGLDSLEAQRLRSFVEFNEGQHRLQSNGNLSTITLPAGNLLWTLQGLSVTNRRQNYLFLRTTRSRLARRWDLEAVAIVDLDDRSSIWIPQVNYDFTRRISGYLRVSLLAGTRHSEFGSLPVRRSAALGLAFHF